MFSLWVVLPDSTPNSSGFHFIGYNRVARAARQAQIIFVGVRFVPINVSHHQSMGMSAPEAI
jgi:hypothetical protein